ncbi:OVARIAN TUMOR DOMAIN-containing deubiquitinating enzyme 1-like isoform X2 [Lolium perenne]
MPEKEDGEGEDDGGWNWEQEEAEYTYGHLGEGELEDDADSQEPVEGELGYDQDRGENLRGPSDSEFFSILGMSVRRNIPDHIIRNGFVPLNKHDYFSCRHNWRLLLGHYRSFLPPSKDHRVLIGSFRRPYNYPRALRFQEPISDLILRSSNNYIIQEKIKILSKQYGLFRRTRSDGSCFYRALLFSYLENLGQMQDRQAEVIRLMECVEVSIKRIYQLEWGEAYFLNPKDNILSVVYEFYCLVNSVANGLTSDKLYERSLGETSSGNIIYFLRLLTEAEIRTHDIYKPFIPKDMHVLQFCWKKVRGMYAEAGAIQMRALTYALGIPLRVETVDRRKSTLGQDVRVKRLDFFNHSGLGKRPYYFVQSYHSSSTAHKSLERGSGDNLLSSDGAPLLTLLNRPGHCDILYPK